MAVATGPSRIASHLRVSVAGGSWSTSTARRSRSLRSTSSPEKRVSETARRRRSPSRCGRRARRRRTSSSASSRRHSSRRIPTTTSCATGTAGPSTASSFAQYRAQRCRTCCDGAAPGPGRTWLLGHAERREALRAGGLRECTVGRESEFGLAPYVRGRSKKREGTMKRLGLMCAVGAAALVAIPATSAKDGDVLVRGVCTKAELVEAEAERGGRPYRGRVRSRPESQRHPLDRGALRRTGDRASCARRA